MDTSYDRLNNTVPEPRSRRNYKPLILRVPCLLFVALIAGALIGVLEYAARELPHSNKARHNPIESPRGSTLAKRQTAATTTTSAADLVVSTPAQSVFVSTEVTSTPEPGVFVATETTSASGQSVTVVSGPLSTAPESVYVPTDVTATAPGSVYVPTDSTTSVTGSMNPLTAAGSQYAGEASTATGSDFVPTNTPGFAPPSDYVSESVTATTPSSVYVSTQVSTQVTISVTQTSSSTSSVVTTNSQGQATTVATVVPVTAVVQSVVPTVIPTTTSIPIQENNNGLQRLTILTWPLWKVFVGSYLPVMCAIIFKIFWTAIYSKIKLIQPFIRMAQPGGAVAADTLHTYYLSSLFTPEPIVSLFRGHWLILWSSIVYLVSATLPSLSTEAIFLDTNYDCPNPDLTSHNPCWPPRLSVDPLVVRWLQGLLGYICVMTLGLMVMLIRSRTGLSHDPSSIAGVAALVHHPTVLEDFRSFRDEASIKEIRVRLGNRRYKLDDYRRSDGSWRYGIVPIDAPIDYEWNDKEYTDQYSGLSNGAKRQRSYDNIWDSLFLLFLIGIQGVLIAYFKSSGDNGFNNFFNSNTFGPRFFMAAMATIISLNWKRLERDVHTLTPYFELSRSPAPASSTILLRRRSIPYTAFFGMVWNKHFFAACMAITAIFSDILVISLAGVPYSPGQIFMELIVCSYVSMAIIGVMIISMISLLIWRRRSPDLPRTPDTLMAVMSYVSDSNMLEDFDGLESAYKREMDDRIRGLGKRYGYGRSLGMDGQKRFMVDEEFKLIV